MTQFWERVREKLEEQDEEDLEDYMSEGASEDLDDFEEPVKIDETFPKTICICNVPKVSKEKYDKLMGVLSKVIDKHGKNEKSMEINAETGLTDGFLIVTFEAAEASNSAVQTLDGMILDKNHTFKVVKLDTFDEITNRPEHFEPKRTLNYFQRGDFRQWLADKNAENKYCSVISKKLRSTGMIQWQDILFYVMVGSARSKARKSGVIGAYNGPRRVPIWQLSTSRVLPCGLDQNLQKR